MKLQQRQRTVVQSTAQSYRGPEHSRDALLDTQPAAVKIA